MAAPAMTGVVSPAWVVASLLVLFAVLMWFGFAIFAGAERGRPRPRESWRARLRGRISLIDLPRPTGRGLLHALFRQRWVWLGSLVALLAIGLIFSVSDRIRVNPAEAIRWAHAADIRLRLNEEKLAPPPPLAPAVFASAGRAGLETANRDWSRLDPDFAQQILRLLRNVERRGFAFVLLEGYRSPEQQDAMALRGPHVTHARAWQSKHQFGLAADLAPIREGRLMISEQDPWAYSAYQALGEEAMAMGLVWGGNWSLRDYGHIESAGAIPGGRHEKQAAMMGMAGLKH